eukprot:364011-Chlamydomonas_euryale.AAC.14
MQVLVHQRLLRVLVHVLEFRRRLDRDPAKARAHTRDIRINGKLAPPERQQHHARGALAAQPGHAHQVVGHLLVRTQAQALEARTDVLLAAAKARAGAAHALVFAAPASLGALMCARAGAAHALAFAARAGALVGLVHARAAAERALVFDVHTAAPVRVIISAVRCL